MRTLPGFVFKDAAMKKIPAVIMLLAMPFAAYAVEMSDPGFAFDETIFQYIDGAVTAPRALGDLVKMSGRLDGTLPGWVQDGGDGYIAFDAGEVFSKDEGAVDICLVVLDPVRLSNLGNDLESLVTLYDKEGAPFFSIGINDHDLAVGSYQLHPVVMEKVFGGVGFPYVAKLDGPLEKGANIAVTVTWGREPSENRVYVNGKFIEVAVRKGPKHHGNPPGYEPELTLGSFMDGFGVFDGRVVGPPNKFVIGRIGVWDPTDPLSMLPPLAVGIRSVRVRNFIAPPAGTTLEGN